MTICPTCRWARIGNLAQTGSLVASDDDRPPVSVDMEPLVVHVPVLNQEQLHRMVAMCRDAIRVSKALGSLALDLLQQSMAALQKWEGDPPPPPPAEPHLKVVSGDKPIEGG